MFQVEWLQTALDDLASIWNQADSGQRQAITRASHQVDQLLAQDPIQEGESRPHGRRIFFVPPLAVTFFVDEAGKTVTVLHMRMFRTRKQ